MNAADIPPDVLDRMLADLARECVKYRRALGDSNCEADEVIGEAYVDAGGAVRRAGDRINTAPMAAFFPRRAIDPAILAHIEAAEKRAADRMLGMLRAAKVTTMPASEFIGDYLHSETCDLVRGGPGFGCTCSPPTEYHPVITKP